MLIEFATQSGSINWR